MKARILFLLLAGLPLAGLGAPAGIPVPDNIYDKAKDTAELIQKIDKARDSNGAYDKGYKGLTGPDDSSSPDYDPPGAPQVPSDCPDGGKPCFAAAYEKLNRCRANLERLRAVRTATEDFYKASVSFGDDVSSIHGVAGLAWQAERRKIDASFKNFKGIYEKKYQELMGKLQEALLAVSACEKEVYDESDWFNRYGFMYYQFMESRYAW
jgi:hypothetical protein